MSKKRIEAEHQETTANKDGLTPSGETNQAPNPIAVNHIKQHPPLAVAGYITGRLASGRVAPVKLAAEFGVSIATIIRSWRLYSCEGMIPECWRQDLSNEAELAYPGPAIRFGHWIEAMGCFGKLGAPAVVLRTLEECHAERWTPSRLKRELRQLSALAPTGRTSSSPTGHTHMQVSVPGSLGDGEFTEVGEGVAPLLGELWQLNILPGLCLDDIPEGTISLEFGDSGSAERFLTIVAQAAETTPGIEDHIYERVLGYPIDETDRSDWICSPSVIDVSFVQDDHDIALVKIGPITKASRASVEFPRNDYAFVLRALQEASDAQPLSERPEPLNEDDPFPMRAEAEVLAAENELFDKLWYCRSKRYEDHETVVGLAPPTPEILKAAENHCKELEVLYPAEELPPWSAYQYGEACGKLSALRWAMGYEWDVLDT
ncbi:MAG: hypothetical protein HN341_00890 [Verrucomicrobia bacterium]|jgi:hypothetical protein|nr:hypothetical protein [Verrucomicrobiota bacterium]